METKEIKKQSPIKSMFENENIVKQFNKVLGDRSQAFITSVLQIVSSSEILKKCTPASIVSCAMTAATLDLPINNTIGHAYIVPFGTNASLIIGYKGLAQLARRSGQYVKLEAMPIYDGQLVAEDPINGHKWDWSKKSNKIIGYFAFYKLKSGEIHELYMTTEQIHAHAKKYSKTYGNKNGAWATNEKEMSEKTVFRILLSKGAPMAIQYEKAFETDEFVPDNIPDHEFEEAEYVPTNTEKEELLKKIEQYNTAEDLEVLKMSVDPNVYQSEIDKIESKIEEINNKNAKKK